MAFIRKFETTKGETAILITHNKNGQIGKQYSQQ